MPKFAAALFSAALFIACARSHSGHAGAIGIIGGRLSDPTESSYVAAIVNLDDDGTCTASILSQTTLLTAAHCVSSAPENLRAIFGADLHAETAHTLEVQAVRTQGALALVRIGSIPTGFAPVHIADNVTITAGDDATLLGFGVDNGTTLAGLGLLRAVDATIAQITANEVEFNQSHGTGACHGDSGGPALIGGAAWAVADHLKDDPENNCSTFSVYTLIAPQRLWIKTTLEAWATPAP